MAGLASLIRLRKHELDEQRRKLTELQTRRDVLVAQERRLLDDIDAEKKHAAIDDETRTAFPNYLKRVTKQLDVIRAEYIKLDAAITAAQAKLQDAFKELKTYEITEANRAAHKAAELKKKEDQTMDDIGIDGYARKQRDNDQ